MTGSAKKPLKFAKRKLSNLQQKLHNFSFGQRGELKAAKFLLDHGYELLESNLKFGKFEVDLVVFDHEYDEVVFVEVKTRASDDFGSPSQAVDYKKKQAMSNVAREYMLKKKFSYDYRFDIIAITPEGVEHYENVTW